MTGLASLYSRWLGKRPPARDPRPRVLEADGSFRIAVVGEASYQDNLERICGARKKDGENLVTDAVLIPEDDNPADRNAVRVTIRGLTVGYLSRPDAADYRKGIQGASFARVQCKAQIRGGWDRGPSDRGHYGVWLDF